MTPSSYSVSGQMLVRATRAAGSRAGGLRLGADDYVTKPFSVVELLARVEALLRRVATGPALSQLERFGDIEVDTATHMVRRRGGVVALAPKEFDLLLALLRRQGAVASRPELMREVWSYPDTI